MRMRFKFVQIEDVVNGLVHDPSFQGSGQQFSALDGKVNYKEVISTCELSTDLKSLIGFGDIRDTILSDWRGIVERNQFRPSGNLNLKNLLSFGTRGLLLDLDRHVALVGGALNWGDDYARYYISTAPPQYQCQLFENDHSFEIDIPSVFPTEARPGIFMMGPGQDIYGHWLLDYAPRLMLAGLVDGPEAPRYYFGNLPHWTAPILASFGVSASAICPAPTSDFVYYPRIAMPSATKIGYRLSQPINRMAWLRLKNMLLNMPITLQERIRIPNASQIFVSRKSWGSSRAIENASRLEEIAAKRGFTIVHPEEYSLPGQARIFNRARAILGEDGSGLHNIIFSEPGCRLGVVSIPERVNLWHLGICEQLEHSIAYIVTESNTHGARLADETAFNQLIDVIG